MSHDTDSLRLVRDSRHLTIFHQTINRLAPATHAPSRFGVRHALPKQFGQRLPVDPGRHTEPHTPSPAACMPARARSAIKARSYSANAANICTTIRPAGSPSRLTRPESGRKHQNSRRTGAQTADLPGCAPGDQGARQSAHQIAYPILDLPWKP